MADFRQQAPQPEPVRRDLSGARNFQASPGILGAVLGVVPGLTQSMNDRADREFDNKLALAFTDSAITGIGRDTETEEINVAASKLTQRNGQRSPHNESRLRATVEARRLAEKYPHRAAQVFEKFGLMTGQPILNAAREIEEEALRPIKEQEAQVDQWSLAEGVPLEWDRQTRTELFLGGRERIMQMNEAEREAAYLRNQGMLSNHNAHRLLRREAPGLYEQMSALLTDVTGSIDPFNTPEADKLQMMNGYREIIDGKIDEIIDRYDGHLTRQEAEQVLAPTLNLFTQIQRWANGEITIEALEQANLFLRIANDNDWLNIPDFQDFQKRAALLGSLQESWGTPMIRNRVGNEALADYRNIVSSLRRGTQSPTGNAIDDAYKEGKNDKEVATIVEYAMRALNSIATNPDADPVEAAVASELLLNSYTEQFSDDPGSVPTAVYDAILFALADPEVGPWLNDQGVLGGDSKAFNNYRRMSQRYFRDLNEDVIDEISKLERPGHASTMPSAGGLGMGTTVAGLRELARGTLNFEVKPNGNVKASATDPTNQSSVRAAERFNDSHSDRFGMLARAQAHLFGQQGSAAYIQAGNQLMNSSQLDSPNPETLESDFEVALRNNMTNRGFNLEEIEYAIQATQGQR